MGRVTDISEMMEESFELGFVNQSAAFGENEEITTEKNDTPVVKEDNTTEKNEENNDNDKKEEITETVKKDEVVGPPDGEVVTTEPKPTPGGGNKPKEENPGVTYVAVNEQTAQEEEASSEAPSEEAQEETDMFALLRITDAEENILSNQTVDAQEGATLDLDGIMTDGEIPEFVEWESSNTDIATVDENGVVTFLKEGNVTISAHQMSDETEEASILCSSSVKFTVAAPEPTLMEQIGGIWPYILIGLLSVAIVILLIQRSVQEKRRKAAARKRRQRKVAEQATNETTAVNMAADDTEHVVQPYAGVRSGVFQAIGARKDQQDSYGMTDPALYAQQGVLALVADGMGGLANGKAVSAALVNTFLGEFRNIGEYSKPQDTLMKLAISANQRINQMLVGQDRSGSTLVSAIIRDGCLYFLTVGDSRIYLYRGGALLQMNREHIYQEELAVKAINCQVPISQITGDRQTHALTSFFGSGCINHIDRNYEGIRLVPGDRIMLCSDGVFGTLTQAQMEYALSQDVKTAAEMLKDMVRDAGKAHQDNNTGMILEYLG